jgi:tRNA G46 methylase TrmB
MELSLTILPVCPEQRRNHLIPTKAQPQLNVLGIEAYAQIIERIWTRRAYANLTILPINMEAGQNND